VTDVRTAFTEDAFCLLPSAIMVVTHLLSGSALPISGKSNSDTLLFCRSDMLTPMEDSLAVGALDPLSPVV